MGNTKIIYPSLVILFVILLNFFCKSVFNILVIAKFSKCATFKIFCKFFLYDIKCFLDRIFTIECRVANNTINI